MTLPFEEIVQTPEAPSAGVDVLGTANRTVDPDRWALVVVFLEADPAATQSASINITADLDDDGVEEDIGQAFAQGGLNSLRRSTVTFLLPPGREYSVDNSSDPDNGNLATAYEFVL